MIFSPRPLCAAPSRSTSTRFDACCFADMVRSHAGGETTAVNRRNAIDDGGSRSAGTSLRSRECWNDALSQQLSPREEATLPGGLGARSRRGASALLSHGVAASYDGCRRGMPREGVSAEPKEWLSSRSECAHSLFFCCLPGRASRGRRMVEATGAGYYVPMVNPGASVASEGGGSLRGRASSGSRRLLACSAVGHDDDHGNLNTRALSFFRGCVRALAQAHSTER